MSFFDTEELVLDEKLIFLSGTPVVMTILDYTEKNGSLLLNCLVKTGQHEGKTHRIYINNGTHEIAKKQRSQFLLAFWSKDEILGKQVNPAKLVARKMSVMPGKTREHNGTTYQNFGNFRDLGADEPDDEFAF